MFINLDSILGVVAYLAMNLQLFADIDADEFNPVLRREITPKVLITTCRFNSTVRLFAQKAYK